MPATVLDRIRDNLFSRMLFAHRIAVTLILLGGLLLQAIPALRLPSALLLLGLVAISLFMSEGCRVLLEGGRRNAAVLLWIMGNMSLAAIGTLLLRLPGLFVAVIALMVFVSALLNGAATALLPALIGLLLYGLMIVVQNQAWLQALMVPEEAILVLIAQLFFVAMVVVITVLICELTAQRLERSVEENAVRALEAEQARNEATALADQLGDQVENQSRLLKVIQQLEVPMIPLSDQVLVVPLVGQLESRRFAAIERALLERVAAGRVSLVLADISAVPEVDSAIAARLLRIGQAVRLLGAELALTGIRPAVAQTIVRLGLHDFTLRSYATIQDAVADQTPYQSL